MLADKAYHSLKRETDRNVLSIPHAFFEQFSESQRGLWDLYRSQRFPEFLPSFLYRVGV